jgi:methyl-accepting chemotaxis protein
MDLTEVEVELIGDLIVVAIFTILVLYIIHRDTKRQDFADIRYDKLIHGIIDNISKQQDQYKQEIITEIRELSDAVIKVLKGTERVVSGVKDVESEVTKVSSGVDRVVNEVDRVTTGIGEVSSGIKNIVLSLQTITNIIDKELEARNVLYVFKEGQDKIDEKIDEKDIDEKIDEKDIDEKIDEKDIDEKDINEKRL